VADDVRVVGAFLRLEEHRNVPPRRDIEAALAIGWWCIAVDRAVPDGDGVPIVAIVRRKSVHALLKNLKEVLLLLRVNRIGGEHKSRAQKKKEIQHHHHPLGIRIRFCWSRLRLRRIEKDGGLFVSNNRARCY